MRNTIAAAACTFALALPLAAGGCGADETETPEPADQPDSPLVTYERGGGVAGVLESLVIENDGSATVTVGVEQRSNEFELAEADLELLEQELAAADFDDVEEAPANSGCADCFEYTVEHGDERLTIDDLDQPGPSLQKLLGHLSVIAADHYPPGVSPVHSGA